MKFIDYIVPAMRTAKTYATLELNIRHAAYGLTTEAGELFSILKRVEVYGKSFDETMQAKAREELGDWYWYLALLVHHVGANWDEEASPRPFGDDLKDSTPVDHMMLSMNTVSAMATLTYHGMTPTNLNSLSSLIPTVLPVIDDGARALGFDPDQLRAENIEKLRARYPEKYSDELAEARLDKGGADAFHS